MKSPAPVKQKRARSQLVGVIASRPALVRACRLRAPPDFFELRLDALSHSLGQIETNLPRLGAPLILTVRHPREGGIRVLSTPARANLFRRFLDFAALVDLELRFVRQLSVLLDEVGRRGIGLLLSHHNFQDTPPVTELHRLTKRAAAFDPAIFKLATRTDQPSQLARLATFLSETDRYPFPIAVVGMGKLGSISRFRFDQEGSALTYVSLGAPNVEGQPSLAQLRRARRTY